MNAPEHADSQQGKIRKSAERSRFAKAAYIAATSMTVAVFLEMFRESVKANGSITGVYLIDGVIEPTTIAYLLAFFLVSFGVLLALVRRGKPVADFCFRWRYLLGIALIAFAVLFEISGSSVGCWSHVLSETPASSETGLLFGLPRPIRSDEWIVFSPMAFSQEWTGYSDVSDLIRATPTDVTMTYGQPCWALATLFRPFLWGYLFLGSAKGLSFFWCARTVALFLASFEFGRAILTDDNRLAALAYASLVTFAPVVQWWFAVNGIAELLIFGQILVLAFKFFLPCNELRRRVALSILFAYSAGCFIMVLYPAWQIPLAYVVLALLVGEVIAHLSASRRGQPHGTGDSIVKNASTSRSAAKRPLSPWGRWLPPALALIAMFAALALIFFHSRETVIATMNTDYPGERFETGGGYTSFFFTYFVTWFAPIIPEVFPPNVCEACDGFTSLFPLGLALSALALSRRRDVAIICLLAADALLVCFCCIGIPAWLAKITLLSYVTPSRCIIAVTLIDILLAFRALSVIAASRAEAKHVKAMREPLNSLWATFGIAVIISGVLAAASLLASPLDGVPKRLYVLAAIYFALLVFAIIRSIIASADSWMLCVAACVLALSGFCVNPVQKGIDPLTESEFYHSVSETVNEDPNGIWIADAANASQACLASGARTLTSINTYPNFDAWSKIDPDETFRSIYNRYAHISVTPTEESSSFELEGLDSFILHVNPDDLETLGVSYWVSKEDLQSFDTEHTHFENMAKAGPYTVFRVENVS